MSDPAIISGDAADALGIAPHVNDVASTSAPAMLRPLPTPYAAYGAPRRWASEFPIVDAAMLLLANGLYLLSGPVPGSPALLLLLFDLTVVALIAAWRGYSPRLRLDALDDVRMTVTSTAVATMLVVSLDAVLTGAEPSAYGAIRLWLLTTLLLAAGRLGANFVVVWRRERSRSTATTIIVGAGKVGRLAASRLLDHTELGLRPIGFLDAEPMEIGGKPLPLPVLGTNANLRSVVETHDVQCAVVAFSTDSHDSLLGLLDECDRLGIRTIVVPRLFERVPSRLQVTHVGGLPLLEMRPTSPHSIQFAVKYALDRILSFAMLLILAPILGAIALAVALSLGRPILYRQDRVSLDGRRFNMLKFRTMESASEDDGDMEFHPELAPGGVEGADRRTRIGAFLRRWSLDELPQLVNVLKGDMSLVGPRPERPEYAEYFGAHVRRYDRRLRTKAGITGWAQVHRLRGNTSIADRVEWDNYYIENFSLWLDVKIMLRTLPEAFRGRAT